MNESLFSNEGLCALAQNGDSCARDALVEQNIGFVRQTANNFFLKNEKLCHAHLVDVDDLIQEGCIGFLKAIALYQSEQGNKFLTYAASAVRSAMWDVLRDHSTDFEQQVQSSDGLTRVSLSDVIGVEEKGERVQFIADALSKTPEELYIEAESMQELRAGMELIPRRECAYLRYRFGFDDEQEHTRKEAAYHLHLSVSRAKSTEETALEHLRLELPWWYWEPMPRQGGGRGTRA